MFCCGCSRSRKMNGKKKNGTIPKNSYIYKEGFMNKHCGFIKMWKPRYFVLLDDILCYFLKEEDKENLTPSGRIFFSDIDMIDRVNKKAHPFSLQIQTDTKNYVFSCSTFEDREDWVNQISTAKEKHRSQELNDPIRRRSTRLNKDNKRITIKKDPKHGIGCTIKNVGGAIYVSRIIPDGPVATSGALRPGDQIIDINGNRVSNCPIEKIKDIIRTSPEYIVCTVKPVTHYTSHDASPTAHKKAYTEVDPELLQQNSDDEDNFTQLKASENKGGRGGGYVELHIGHGGSTSLALDDSGDEKLEEQYQRSDITDSKHSVFGSAEDNIGDPSKSTKKLTNYAELEFNVKR